MNRSAFHIFLGISYPGEEAAERGLREGLISQREYDRILAATHRKVCPPLGTPILIKP